MSRDHVQGGESDMARTDDTVLNSEQVSIRDTKKGSEA